MSKSPMKKELSHGNTNVNQGNSFDFSKSEETIKSISIPQSEFRGLWVKDKGFSIGYESVKLTKDYETLEEALNQIGYGVEVKEDGDELVKVGDCNYEMVVRIVRAVLILNEQNNEKNN